MGSDIAAFFLYMIPDSREEVSLSNLDGGVGKEEKTRMLHTRIS